MKVNINITPLSLKAIPKTFKRPNGMTVSTYPKATEFHQEDGFRTPVEPEYDNKTHQLGELILEGENVTYKVVLIPYVRVISAEKQNIIDIKAKYEQHKKAGWNAYQDFRAKTMTARKNGDITDVQSRHVQSFLRRVYELMFNSGDWKDALDEVKNLSVSDNYIKPYKDALQSDINDYIEMSY